MELKYSYKVEDKSKTTRSMGRDMNISFKNAVVICDEIRGMMLQDAISLLQSTISLKNPIPFKRFNKGVGHRRGIGIGKYPKRAAEHILNVLRNVETNAEYKGLDIDRLKIVHIQAKEGVSRRRRKPKGRWRIWCSDLVNVEVVAEEI